MSNANPEVAKAVDWFLDLYPVALMNRDQIESMVIHEIDEYPGDAKAESVVHALQQEARRVG